MYQAKDIQAVKDQIKSEVKAELDGPHNRSFDLQTIQNKWVDAGYDPFEVGEIVDHTKRYYRG